MVQVGILLNSALYLAGVFIAGLWTSDDLAWKGALAAFGFTYLAYMAQDISEQMSVSLAPGVLLTVVSILLGAGAGLALLV